MNPYEILFSPYFCRLTEYPIHAHRTIILIIAPFKHVLSPFVFLLPFLLLLFLAIPFTSTITNNTLQLPIEPLYHHHRHLIFNLFFIIYYRDIIPRFASQPISTIRLSSSILTYFARYSVLLNTSSYPITGRLPLLRLHVYTPHTTIVYQSCL